MILQDKDYQNYDYIEIIVKKNSADEIVYWYSRFLWKEYQRKEDKRYADVIHISFSRPHKIPSKDRLQLLQVYFENILNTKARLLESKHSKFKAMICVAIFVAILGLLGVGAFIFFIKSWLGYLLAGATAILSTCIDIVFCRYIKKLYKKENHNFDKKSDDFAKQIDEIIGEVNQITGVDEK